MEKIVGFIKKEKLLVLALAITVAIFGAGFLTTERETSPASGDFIHVITIQEVGQFEVLLSEGQTAKDALMKASSENNFSVEYQEFDFGQMVTSISKKSANEKYFWALYYNDKMAEVGADSLILEKGDKTEWKYEQLQF